MQIISGNKKEDLLIEKDALVIGSVEGDIKVLSGAKLHLTAKLIGNLHLSRHSIVSIQNNIIGNIYDSGATIEIVSGELHGEIIR
ncbi:hypothetical protein [Halalkalibacter akibai]|uniref:Cell shape determination protein CcmA n=1 Tax=Halalkalibacter akibai (strain ATCC 43226 / DSM 21942 / CIP 109018 / JCM 9157 / 1139) TaxID=1236973 RepID=W4QZQ7_HALA3|nr:hypothetical protein [Halalkalibacter akibai]GAE37615.1 hypothetical protein JCM9157_4932 [Halalkalibacter akibai JCM 9157]